MRDLQFVLLLVIGFLSAVLGYPQADNPSVFWRQTLVTSGKAAFNSDTTFTVYRNVKNYGARGDGSTDDTAAIQAALNAGTGRTLTSSTTTTPAIIYFPAGTYIISSTIQIPYYTQLVGSAISGASSNIKATSAWGGGWMIDADPYQSTGQLGVGSTNDFYKEIRDLNFDLSASTKGGAALHWPTAQACHLQGITITMSTDSSTTQVGIFIESGSGGFMSDITFNGGDIGLNVGNQQFQSRGLTFNNCKTAINQIWNWTWLYQGLSINNCKIGINMASMGDSGQLQVGSITVLDSTFVNTPIGISTATTSSSSPATAGSLIIDNTQFTNSPTAVQGANGAVLLNTGSSLKVQFWAQGHYYSGTTKSYKFVQNSITGPPKDGGLLANGAFLTKSRPTYAGFSYSKFISVKTAGAKGDGSTDDTATLQSILNANCAGKIIFFDAGAYIVTDTLNVPAGCWIVGEGESVIMARGSNFASAANPRVVLKVGNTGDSASTQISGMMFSNQGSIPGAIMLQWNIVDSSGASGMWSTHFRIGGAKGTSQENNCPTSYSTSSAPACMGAFLKFHLKGSGYFENMWLWTADHLLDDGSQAQINIYTARGLLIESTGASVFNSVASEHCTTYMYQINTKYPLYMGLLQSETPYYQPSPAAPSPFVYNSAYGDPVYSSSLTSALALRVVNSPSVLIYGAGLYSFFSDYTQSCITARTCQPRIVSIENSTPYIYNLNTIGSSSMLTLNNQDIIAGADNANVYPDCVVAYVPGGLSVTSVSTSMTSTAQRSTTPTVTRVSTTSVSTTSVSTTTTTTTTSTTTKATSTTPATSTTVISTTPKVSTTISATIRATGTTSTTGRVSTTTAISSTSVAAHARPVYVPVTVTTTTLKPMTTATTTATASTTVKASSTGTGTGRASASTATTTTSTSLGVRPVFNAVAVESSISTGTTLSTPTASTTVARSVRPVYRPT